MTDGIARMKQTTSHVLMVEPLHFGFNAEAAITNSFQNKSDLSQQELTECALKEFYNSVEVLRSFGVSVTVVKGDPEIHVPDAVFPNNWLSTHASGALVLYPMAVTNRRAERRKDIIDQLLASRQYHLADLSHYENGNPPRFLEGTGSLIFDHVDKIVYAAISPRTHEKLVQEVAEFLGYTAICFRSYGKSGEMIYHTNVMMCVGETFVVIGDKTIDPEDWAMVKKSILESGKVLIALTNEQVYDHFAGNMLQVSNSFDQKLLVMSTTARKSLTDGQLEVLSEHNDHLVVLDIPTIEFVGGGSARCMLAEVR